MHTPDQDKRDLVKKLSSLGTRYNDIASRLKISDDTLKKYYREELDDGRIDANAKVAGTLYQQAIEGNMTACIFWMKTQGGFRETDPNQNQNGEKIIRRHGGIPTEDV